MKRKLILFSLFTSLFFASCGIDKTYKNGEVSMSFSEAIEAGGSPLGDSEMAVALRICYAFRSKRTKFLAELLETSFNFGFQEHACDGAVTRNTLLNTTLKQLDSDGPMSYEATGVNFGYQREVLTDINGELSGICTQVLKGETPLNVSEFNNEYHEFSFVSDLYDTAVIKVGSKNQPSDAVPTVNQVIRLEVLTSQQSSGDYLGTVYRHTRFYPCGGDTFKTKTQTFSAP